MATARESQTCHQQFSAQNSSYLDQMTLVHLNHNYHLPRTTDFAYRGESDSFMRGLSTVQQDNVGGFLTSVPPYCNFSYYSNEKNTSLKDSSQSSLINGIGLQGKEIYDAHQKRLLIFDQSRNRTRLYFSSSFSPPNRAFASETPASANGYGSCNDVATRVDEGFLMKPVVEEKWGENHLSDGDGEMLEDTEEINALLYSDSDDEDYDDDNDEVTSTRQSPSSKEQSEELREEVASSDDSPKRRRLLDGNYKKSSQLASGERAISCNHEDDVESICAVDRNSYNDDDDLDSRKRKTKVKIRHALKMLESIVPGLNSKDPLSIIDKAIVYLKSMKIEAESLGLRHSG